MTGHYLFAARTYLFRGRDPDRPMSQSWQPSKRESLNQIRINIY